MSSDISIFCEVENFVKKTLDLSNGSYLLMLKVTLKIFFGKKH